MARCKLLGLVLLLAALPGCSRVPKTYPVRGKLVFERGDVKLLAGNALYCRHEQDAALAARGDIREDGSFVLETHAGGQILRGVPEGTYRAWIILDTDNGSEERQFRAIKLDPRLLSGTTSPWTLKVPSESEVVFTVTRAKPGARLPQPPADTRGQRCSPDDEAETSANEIP
jgi:hypothetical protein